MPKLIAKFLWLTFLTLSIYSPNSHASIFTDACAALEIAIKNAVGVFPDLPLQETHYKKIGTKVMPKEYIIKKFAKDSAGFESDLALFVNGGITYKQIGDTLIDGGKLQEKLLTKATKRTWKQLIDEVSKLSPHDFQNLGATQKFDLVLGKAIYEQGAPGLKVTRFELNNRGHYKQGVQDWEGFCNANAAMQICTLAPLNEVAVRLPGTDLDIIFSKHEIQLLVMATYNYVEKYAQIGQPLRGQAGEIYQKNRDIDAGAFHLAVSVLLHKNGSAFAMDWDPGEHLWNTAVIGYRELSFSRVKQLTQVPAEVTKPSRAVKSVDVKITLVELDQSTHEYSYTLFLDANERVCGGYFTKDGVYAPDAAPDFLWFPAGKGTDSKYPDGNPYLNPELVLDLLKKAQSAP